MIEVVVGVILNSNQEVLVAKRPENSLQGGLWEFPGGKIEKGEAAFQALCRELREELGIEILASKPLLQCHHNYKEYQVLLDIWQVTKFSGEPQGLEGQPIQWATLYQLGTLSFPSANQPIINFLVSNVKIS